MNLQHSAETKLEATIVESVGKTPLIPLKNIFGNTSEIFAKLEWFNPSGSLKARASSWMIFEAAKTGVLQRNMTLIEPTSGNTGIAMSKFAKELGYHVELTIPEKISEETKEILRSFGAKLLETEDDLCPRVGPGTDQSIALANALVQNHPEKYYMANQYNNDANFLAHYNTTGPEIWEATKGNVTTFIAGVGTGGTITGVGQYLKEKDQSIRIIAVQPQKNHHIQGLRNLDESEIPELMKRRLHVVDETITVTDYESFQMVKELATKENLFPGPSSGAVIAALKKVMDSLAHGTVVVIFGDDASKYRTVYRQFDVFTDSEYDQLKRTAGFLSDTNP